MGILKVAVAPDSALFGEPQTISKDAEDHPVYIYGTGRFSCVEIPLLMIMPMVAFLNHESG
jgi:hypothetical protein